MQDSILRDLWIKIVHYLYNLSSEIYIYLELGHECTADFPFLSNS